MTKNVLGIDVSKKKIDVYLMIGEKGFAHQFDNSQSGLKALCDWLGLRQAGKVHACLEATGTYSDLAAQTLHEAGHTVSVVNPSRILHFAKSKLRRNKTDKADAQLIAGFCRGESPREWHPPSRQMQDLRALTRRIEALEAMLQMERNRLEGASSPVARGSVGRVTAMLEEEIRALREEIGRFIDGDDDMGEQKQLLRSIGGIGDKTATLLVSEIEFERFDSARSLAAFAGVTPARRHSGTSLCSTQISKVGSARLRARLYFPAIVAMKHNPVLKEFADRLADKGKAKMQIVCAVMRKLLHIAYGVLKNRTPFTPNPA